MCDMGDMHLKKSFSCTEKKFKVFISQPNFVLRDRSHMSHMSPCQELC